MALELLSKQDNICTTQISIPESLTDIINFVSQSVVGLKVHCMASGKERQRMCVRTYVPADTQPNNRL